MKPWMNAGANGSSASSIGSNGGGGIGLGLGGWKSRSGLFGGSKSDLGHGSPDGASSLSSKKDTKDKKDKRKSKGRDSKEEKRGALSRTFFLSISFLLFCFDFGSREKY